MPTSKTFGVFIGLAELKGTAETDKPFTSYLAGAPCVLFNGKSKNTGRGPSPASGPKVCRRHVHESGWTTIAKDEQLTPFLLERRYGRHPYHS